MCRPWPPVANKILRPATVALSMQKDYFLAMPEILEPLTMPEVEHQPMTESQEQREPGYLVICWNDPVNLMEYVTHVFQAVFGWTRQKAEIHMLQVHQEGKSLLARESLEKAEHYVHQLQSYGLHATMEPDR